MRIGGRLQSVPLECFAQCETEKEQRALIDVSAGDTSGFGPRVQGVVEISADGSHVYFVANGVLAPGVAPGNCHPSGHEQELAALRCNLYVYDAETHRTSFIASVPGTDLNNWENSSQSQENVTPDGRFLVFESHGDLTPDDTRTNGYTQIFRYDADQRKADPGLDRRGRLQRRRQRRGGRRHDRPARGEVVPLRGDPTMSNDGSRIFFESPIGLTPERSTTSRSKARPKGSPSMRRTCTSGSRQGRAVARRADRGLYLSDLRWRDVSAGPHRCLRRRSRGRGSSAVCLLGSDAEGDNVFFMTADQLVPEDTDTQVDIYDARVCEPEHGTPASPDPAAARTLPGRTVPRYPRSDPIAAGPRHRVVQRRRQHHPPALVEPAVEKDAEVANALRVVRKTRRSRNASRQKHARKHTSHEKGKEVCSHQPRARRWHPRPKNQFSDDQQRQNVYAE